MGRRYHLPKPKKCPKTGKTMYGTPDLASKAMMRTWSHDPTMNIYNYHTYTCPDCGTWHFGNKKHYEKSIQGTVPSAPTLVPTSAATDSSGDGVNPSNPV